MELRGIGKYHNISVVSLNTIFTNLMWIVGHWTLKWRHPGPSRVVIGSLPHWANRVHVKPLLISTSFNINDNNSYWNTISYNASIGPWFELGNWRHITKRCMLSSINHSLGIKVDLRSKHLLLENILLHYLPCLQGSKNMKWATYEIMSIPWQQCDAESCI